jgi:hypothetical protein
LPHKYGKATSEVAQACIFFTRSSGMNLRLIPEAANVCSGIIFTLMRVTARSGSLGTDIVGSTRYV